MKSEQYRSVSILGLVLGVTVGVTVGMIGCAGKKTVQLEGCPVVSLGETSEDCPWGEIARDLGAEIDAGRPVLPMMENRLGSILSQIRQDAKSPRLLALWGTSINYDELAKGEIIRPEIVDALLAMGGVKVRDGRKVHAGLEHSYGYLLSILRTPYGYKRARWVRDDLEKGFGFTTQGLLGPNPAKGTLLRNLSVLAGRIALDTDPAAKKVLEQEANQAAPEIAAFFLQGLKRRRLEEAVQAGARTITLRTDFVFFRQPGKNAALLVYSVHEKGRAPQLVTAFPVAQGFVDGAFKPEALGLDKPVTTRYNADVPGVTGATPPLTGHRLEIRFSAD